MRARNGRRFGDSKRRRRSSSDSGVRNPAGRHCCHSWQSCKKTLHRDGALLAGCAGKCAVLRLCGRGDQDCGERNGAMAMEAARDPFEDAKWRNARLRGRLPLRQSHGHRAGRVLRDLFPTSPNCIIYQQSIFNQIKSQKQVDDVGIRYCLSYILNKFYAFCGFLEVVWGNGRWYRFCELTNLAWVFYGATGPGALWPWREVEANRSWVAIIGYAVGTLCANFPGNWHFSVLEPIIVCVMPDVSWIMWTV